MTIGWSCSIVDLKNKMPKAIEFIKSRELRSSKFYTLEKLTAGVLSAWHPKRHYLLHVISVESIRAWSDRARKIPKVSFS